MVYSLISDLDLTDQMDLHCLFGSILKAIGTLLSEYHKTQFYNCVTVVTVFCAAYLVLCWDVSLIRMKISWNGVVVDRAITSLTNKQFSNLT